MKNDFKSSSKLNWYMTSRNFTILYKIQNTTLIFYNSNKEQIFEFSLQKKPSKNIIFMLIMGFWAGHKDGYEIGQKCKLDEIKQALGI